MKNALLLCVQRTVILLGLTSALLSLSACKSADTSALAKTQATHFAKKEPLEAVALLPEKTPESIALRNGMLLAQEDVNRSGGVLGHPFQIQFIDMQANGFVDPQLLEKALAKHPSILWIAGETAVNLAPELLTYTWPILPAFLSEYPPVPSLLPQAVRIYPNGPALAQSVFEVAHTTDITSVAIFYANGLVNESLCNYLAFLMHGDGIRVYRDRFSHGEKNFALLAEHLHRIAPEAVYAIGPAEDIEALVQALDAGGYKGPLLGLLAEPINGNATPALSKRLIYAHPESPITPAFAQAYHARFGTAPTWAAAYGYENVVRIANAANSATTREPIAIRTALMAQHAPANSALPALFFEKDGDTQLPLERYIPEGVTLPRAIPSRGPALMEKQEAPILLLDPYTPPAKE